MAKKPIPSSRITQRQGSSPILHFVEHFGGN
jgi:hypothetical protein